MEKIREFLGLSLRETEVLHHVAKGQTNEDISSILKISERTVEKHLERVYKKLGVDTRTAAVILFFNRKSGMQSPS
jgi:DNA-binding CsgD family transcriptional regulator